MMKIKLTPNIFPLKVSSTKFQKLLREFLLKQITEAEVSNPLVMKQQTPKQGASQQQIANQKAKNPHNNPKRNGINQPIFPMDFILFKFPNVKKVLTELLTTSFRNYVGNMYVMAPKPTTIKVELKNKQFFQIIYDERSYKVKASGQKFDLINLAEKERAIKAIALLLNTKQFITTKSEAENDKHTGPESEAGSKSSKKGGGGGHPGRPPENKGGESPEDLSDLDKLLGNEGKPEEGEEAPKGEEGKEDKEELKEVRIKFDEGDVKKLKSSVVMDFYHKKYQEASNILKEKMRLKGYDI